MSECYEMLGTNLLKHHLAEIVLTLLTLNVTSHVVTGGWEIETLGLRAPTFPVSLAIWGVFLFWRLAGKHVSTQRLVELRAWLWERRFVLALAGLFVVSLWLRLWGNSFGLPVMTHPDEPDVMAVVARMLRTGSLDPNWFLYPSFYMYLLLPFVGLRTISLRGSYEISSLRDAHQLEPAFYEVGRTVSGVMGAATVVLFYLLATQFFPGRAGRRAGLVAASILTFSFLHVRESHHAVTDATLTFLVTLALIAIGGLMRQGRDRDYLVAGAVVGLAGATKYSAIALLLVLGAAHLMGRTPAEWFSRKPLLAVAGLAGGFLAGTPYALFNWPRFLDHMGFLTTISSPLTNSAARFGVMFGYSFESGFGPFVAAALWTSLVVALHRREARETLLAIHALAFIALVTNAEIRVMPRYWLPAVPAIAVLIGIYTARLSERLEKMAPKTPWVGPVALAVVVAIALFPQADESFRFSRMYAQPDARASAYVWLAENFEEGTVVGSEVFIRGLPNGITYDRVEPVHQRSLAEWRAQGVSLFLLSDDWQRLAEGDPKARGAREQFQARLVPLRRFEGWAKGLQGPGLTAYGLAPEASSRRATQH